MIVAEGAHDQDGNKITPEMIKDLLSDPNDLALDTRITTLGHVQRGGSACAYDRMLGTLQGVEAVNAVLEATPETPTPFIAIDENKITRKPLMEAVQATQRVAKEIEARNFDQAMALRDTEFTDFYNSYMTTTTTDLNKAMHLPQDKVSMAHHVSSQSLTNDALANADCDYQRWSSRRWNECCYPSSSCILLDSWPPPHWYSQWLCWFC